MGPSYPFVAAKVLGPNSSLINKPLLEKRRRTMYSSLSVPKRLALVPTFVVVAIQFLLLRSISSLNITNAYLHHTCFVSQGKYNPGSAYEKDLNDIIKSIPLTSNFSRGFKMMSLGKGPNFVSVTHQCRGDSYGPKCRSCFTNTASELRRRCPKKQRGNNMVRPMSSRDFCINTFEKIDYKNNFCMSNAKTFSVDNYSNMNWLIFINNLTTKAISEKNPSPLYAAGERRLGKDKLYRMVQCMQDISSTDCEECLGSNLLKFQKCLYYKRGARAVGRSCTFRYEFYPFIDTKADLNDIIKSIPLTSNFSRGFEMMSLGKGPNFVSVTHQCRGDSYGPKCRSCFTNTASELRRRCPKKTKGE
ncbi:unnamed protein product [Thlaspi arvense]|uniref:Gnk2-homologous domain-containing protein n=1 Tax=Thlaspi arvense TaxID=13288 RepID=A0AAU9S0E8_THLAR|nr:unnamed protein product [Thlaspi arvense]